MPRTSSHVTGPVHGMVHPEVVELILKVSLWGKSEVSGEWKGVKGEGGPGELELPEQPQQENFPPF